MDDNESTYSEDDASSYYTTISMDIEEPGNVEMNVSAKATILRKASIPAIKYEAMSLNDSKPKRKPTDSESSTDLLQSVDGIYRILDLISEQGSGGLVAKVIIDQDSFQQFVNDICPGAYLSLTKVDFKALDKLVLRPVGVYGSKREIVKLLVSLGAIDEPTAEILRTAKDDSFGPGLRSGLYLVRNVGNIPPEMLVIYWPEDTTWNSDAVTSVSRNRVTFMRYLTKLVDQLICLLSLEQTESISWKDNSDDLARDISNEETDRLFTFEVSKTNEQEENVTVRPGFSFLSHEFSLNEEPNQPPPRLVRGETCQAVLSTLYKPPSTSRKPVTNQKFTIIQLRALLATGTIELSPDIGEEALSALISGGLQDRYPAACNDWKLRKAASKDTDGKLKNMKREEMKKDLANSFNSLESTLLQIITDKVVDSFPILDPKRLVSEYQQLDTKVEGHIPQIFQLYPKIAEEVDKATKGTLDTVPTQQFQDVKERLVLVDVFLDDRPELRRSDRENMIKVVLDQGHVPSKDTPPKKAFLSRLVDLFTEEEPSWEDILMKRAKRISSATKDVEFLTNLSEMRSRHNLDTNPLVESAISTVIDFAHEHFRNWINRTMKILLPRSQHLQELACVSTIEGLAKTLYAERQTASCLLLIRDMEAVTPSKKRVFKIEKADVEGPYNFPTINLTGCDTEIFDPKLEYKVHLLGLSEDHQYNLRLDPLFIPTPVLNPQFSWSFSLPVDYSILFIQVLENDRILLILDDRRENISLYLEKLSTIGRAVMRDHPKRRFRQDKVGRDVLITFDESKRTLSLCMPTKFQLYIYVFDEGFSSLQGWGNAINLAPWYNPDIFVCKSCFVTGSEEVLLIDTGGQARIFSLITQQFRPASLSLHKLPTAVFPSPDGACLLLPFLEESGSCILRAYHWSTFGSTDGIILDISPLQGKDLILTAMRNRSCVHLMDLELETNRCRSVALDITKKVTEFLFKEKDTTKSTSTTLKKGPPRLTHNSLIDCHDEVWTRFPVIPAVQRQTIVSAADRLRKKIIFVSQGRRDRFAPYFANLIRKFEQRTKKPTGDELEGISIEALAFKDFFTLLTSDQWSSSHFRAGEWLVDLLCLIPIHIAITRENRFIPLKDGVTSAELERSLLGAEVGKIVDSLTVGWYESIFQSYMADKPVKVVSSMGEQSVGKSFSLNHLVDTSFAGSAMRTTEGVWMSVTPTSGALIVALDFEGVHSIERSVQEDTLLVLFNTAISNLVLFRNNFALSRDITGLFQSFQSSSTVLDPAANPSLFQSTLVIIIKDVVDSDKSEIVREFSLKFQKIVQEEQDANFISRLHAGQLNIVPWPVIESKQFYILFPALKKGLDQQRVTHHTAGEFLITLKTLMAKLKANDWGALPQTLAAHRAQRLLGMLPNALAYGLSEVQPDIEPLKNLDNDMIISNHDTSSRFYTSGSGLPVQERQSILAALCSGWDLYSSRQNYVDKEWIADLSAYLYQLVEYRVEHVEEWIAVNLSRFKSGHAGVEELRRALESQIVDIKAGVGLCGMQCSTCHLLCLLSRRHEASEPHDCQTDHQCSHNCSFADEHSGGEILCGFSAGHPGQHICVVDKHLCGAPCEMRHKKGCLLECTAAAGHVEDTHMCSAPNHACGKSCDLQLVLSNGQPYTCPGTCGSSSDVEHGCHSCDDRMCPFECQLCKRLCSNSDHLHGLDVDAIHLCGEVHSCNALCSADGICEIGTAPQSIEATFTGRHETFQYTKYTQVAKRLPCVIPLPAGELEHYGKHTHSTDASPFHFCETRCEGCGYLCTQPRGHSQQEHETSHGSMSKTRWAVDGPDGTILELNGRRFSSEDDGAPMMCNLVCQDMGRHVHIDYCRADSDNACTGKEIQHIKTRMKPHPERTKDWVTHGLYWKRSGFKDPYSRDDQANFLKCDAMCPGPEHAGTATNPPQPSYCTSDMFHPPHSNLQGGGLRYLSHDGHIFSCKNPVVLQQAFHVIFVIDRSSTMSKTDRRPLPDTPATARIAQCSDNRLGAAYSALYAFWGARQAALSTGSSPSEAAPGLRRDAYSVILFDATVEECIINDLHNSPDVLLAHVLPHRARFGTDFTSALSAAQDVMRRCWSTERAPVVIFLSDGQGHVSDTVVRGLCRTSLSLGKPLSFHSVSFGPHTTTLRRMARLALEVQRTAPHDPLRQPTVNSSYAEALDTVRLAETFLGIAESLRKPRGSLLH